MSRASEHQQASNDHREQNKGLHDASDADSRAAHQDFIIHRRWLRGAASLAVLAQKRQSTIEDHTAAIAEPAFFVEDPTHILPE